MTPEQMGIWSKYARFTQEFERVEDQVHDSELQDQTLIYLENRLRSENIPIYLAWGMKFLGFSDGTLRVAIQSREDPGKSQGSLGATWISLNTLVNGSKEEILAGLVDMEVDGCCWRFRGREGVQEFYQVLKHCGASAEQLSRLSSFFEQKFNTPIT